MRGSSENNSFYDSIVFVYLTVCLTTGKMVVVLDRKEIGMLE